MTAGLHKVVLWAPTLSYTSETNVSDIYTTYKSQIINHLDIRNEGETSSVALKDGQ